MPAERLAHEVKGLIAAAGPKNAARFRPTRSGKTHKRNLTLGSAHFSDTIVLWTPPVKRGDSDFDFHVFCHLCKTVADLICRALVNNMPLRGGIAVGECHIESNPKILVGQAIVDAHAIEQAQDWIGAALNVKSARRATAEQLEDWAYRLDECCAPPIAGYAEALRI
jgi:hypothetical protein